MARANAITATTGDVVFVNSGSRVDSYNSSIGRYGGSNIGSHGNIVAAGNIVNNGGIIAGTQTAHTPTSLPTLTAPSGAVNLPLGSASPGSLNINVASDSITLSPGAYVVNYLNVNYPGAINVSPAGAVTIYVTGGLNLGGSEDTNGMPSNLTFVVTPSVTTNINSNGALFGNIYAPTAAVNINSAVYGYVVGSSVTLNSGAAVHYDETEACPSTSVAPTLNCVMQIDSATYGAVFGYVNTTGANVELGAGPHNFFSPGAADLGQPILFVPGAVPIATFQTFQTGSSLSYTIGQQSVTATSSSPACSAGLSSALSQLFVDNATTKAARQQVAELLANPQYANWISAAKSGLGPQLTPFQSSLLDAASLVAANADLLGDPAALSASQRARIPAFRTSLFANPAVTQLRLNGDALRASPGAIPCDTIASVDTTRPAYPATAPQQGSLYSQVIALAQSAPIATASSTVAGVAQGSQSAALLAAPGLALAALQPLPALERLQLSGVPVPTGFWSVVGGVAGGAIIGAAIGGTVGGPWGAVVGAVIGGVVGGVTCAVDEKICDAVFGDTCQSCSGGAGDQCGLDNNGNPVPCVDGCCSGTSVPIISKWFYSGVHCSGGASSCNSDVDCGAGLLCVQSCCLNPQTFAGSCPGSTCTANADCNPGNSCLYGCCIGSCGFNGVSCAVAAMPNSCGGGGPPTTCPGGSVCGGGCCNGIIY